MKIILPNPKDTEELGYQLGKRVLLKPSWEKNVFLFGDVGAGKTTLLKGFSRGLGVQEPINSPTFALVSEYPIPKNPSGLTTFSHLDIFRVDGDSVLAFPEIFEKLEDPNLVLALEWAEKLPKNVLPEDRIEVRFTVRLLNDGREVELLFLDKGVPDDKSIRMILEECATPMQIRKHTAAVTKVSVLIAQKLISKNFPVDMSLVRAASLLHDCLWMCEYPELIRSQFPEDIDENSWEKWKNMHEKYKGKNHSQACALFLCEKGYHSTADAVLSDGTEPIVNELTLEQQCLYLGNSYVFGEKIVSLTERLKGNYQQSGISDDPNFRKAILKLECDICDKTGMLPEEIVAY